MMKKITILVLLMVALAGCSKQYFSVVVWNESGQKLKNVKVWEDDIVAYSIGVLSNEKFAKLMGLYTPLGEDIKLTLTEYESGIKREVKVDMQGVIPEKYDNGVVHFTIESPEKVSVSFYYKKPTNY